MTVKWMSVACASIVVVSAIITICGETPIWGQQTTDQYSVEPARVEGDRIMSRGGSGSVSLSLSTTEESPVTIRNRELGLANDEIRKGLKQYREAKTDEEKKQAEESVSTALSKFFELDMQNREDEVRAVEERVKKLREQLGTRREAKDQMIQLQLKVLVNETNGLGFYSGSPLTNAPVRITGEPIYITPPVTYAPGALVPPQPPLRRGEADSELIPLTPSSKLK